MKMKELKTDDITMCVACNGPLVNPEDGAIVFYRVRIAAAVPNMKALQDRAGLQMLWHNAPGSAALAEVFAPTQAVAQEMTDYPSNEEELNKVITSMMIEGRPFNVFDNIDRAIQSATLASTVTGRTSKRRRLGRSEVLNFPNHAVWTLNGNNLVYRGDCARRSVWCRLDAKRARPWKGRTFKHQNLQSYVEEHRASILGAVFTMGRSWLHAGRPKPERHLSSFEGWSHTVGGVLRHAGVTGFLENLDELYESIDEEASEWEIFLTAIGNAWSDRAFTIAELARLITDRSVVDLLPGKLGDEYREQGFTRKLGLVMRSKRDTRFGDDGLHIVRIDSQGSHKGVARWQIKRDR